MTVFEAQRAIDTKDYDSLKNVNFWKLLYSSNKSMEFNLNSEFIQNFICTADEHSATFLKEVWFDDIVSNLMNYITYKFTYEDYEAFFELMARLKDNQPKFFGSAVAYLFLKRRIDTRPKKYLRLVLDYLPLFEDLLGHSYKSLSQYIVTKDDLEDLTNVEIEALKYALEESSLTRASWDVDAIVEIVGKEQYTEWLKQLRRVNSSWKSTLKGIESIYTEEELLQIMDDINPGENMYGLINLMKILSAPGYNYTQEQIDKIATEYNNAWIDVPAAFCEKLTVEQFKEFQTAQPVNIMMCIDGSIDSFAENYNEDSQQSWSYSLINNGYYYKEEDMLKYPNMFDPKYIKDMYFYVSKETFTALNRAWKKRQRYDTKLTDFTYLTKTSYDMHDIDTIMYLKEKTNASNEQFLNYLKTAYFSKQTKLQKLTPLSNLLKG